MRIPICTEATDLIDTLEAFGYQRLIDRMIWTWRPGRGWHLKFSGARSRSGYLSVGIDRHAAKYLGLNPGPKTKPQALIHRLVYALHVGDLPEGGDNSPLTVDHVDGDLTNDLPSNLQIMTRPENAEKGRPYGFGFCNKAGHPLVGANAKHHKNKSVWCRYCDLEGKRRAAYEAGRTKQFTPLPPFHVWVIAHHATKDDLALLKKKGIPMPGVTA